MHSLTHTVCTLCSALVTAASSPIEARKSGCQELVAFARKQLGLPHVWAGDNNNGPTNDGLDCLGLVKYVIYQATGKFVLHNSQAQYNDYQKYSGKPVSYKEVEPGDLLFYMYYKDCKLRHTPAHSSLHDCSSSVCTIVATTFIMLPSSMSTARTVSKDQVIQMPYTVSEVQISEFWTAHESDVAKSSTYICPYAITFCHDGSSERISCIKVQQILSL
jgi:hypothetical protein